MVEHIAFGKFNDSVISVVGDVAVSAVNNYTFRTDKMFRVRCGIVVFSKKVIFPLKKFSNPVIKLVADVDIKIVNGNADRVLKLSISGTERVVYGFVGKISGVTFDNSGIISIGNKEKLEIFFLISDFNVFITSFGVFRTCNTESC